MPSSSREQRRRHHRCRKPAGANWPASKARGNADAVFVIGMKTGQLKIVPRSDRRAAKPMPVSVAHQRSAAAKVGRRECEEFVSLAVERSARPMAGPNPAVRLTV